VRRLILRLAVAALAATVAMVLVLDLGARRKGLVVAVYLDVLFGLLLVGVVVGLRRALPAATELHRRRRQRSVEKQQRPQQLAWLERQVGDARDAGFELPAQFRTVVRSIASAALARRHGIVLDRDPERSRVLVGERVWQLIRPDDPATDLPPGGFKALVADLEAI
jgi:hypothetical protein